MHKHGGSIVIQPYVVQNILVGINSAYCSDKLVPGLASNSLEDLKASCQLFNVAYHPILCAILNSWERTWEVATVSYMMH